MNNEEKLKRLSEQKAKAQEKAKKLENQMKRIRAKEQAERRKIETRKKILIGSMIMEQMDENDLQRKATMDDLNKFLTRDIDRKLFNLPPLKSK